MRSIGIEESKVWNGTGHWVLMLALIIFIPGKCLFSVQTTNVLPIFILIAAWIEIQMAPGISAIIRSCTSVFSLAQFYKPIYRLHFHMYVYV